MEITSNISLFAGILTILAFVVNIIVELTKEIILLPTKLWCIIVAISVNMSALLTGTVLEKTHFGIDTILFAFLSSFIVAFVAMYGFDTFKELWQRFKRGENISENN